MKNFNTNNVRLFVKLLITSWVPIAVLTGAVSWDSTTTAVVMAASTATVDGFFRVFDVGDDDDNA